MNPDSSRLLNEYFRNFSQQRDFNRSEQVADSLAAVIRYSHQNNNPNILNVYDLLRKCCYSHQCYRSGDVAETIIRDYYKNGRNARDFLPVERVSFTKCLNDRIKSYEKQNSNINETIDLIAKFERKFVIPERYQQKVPTKTPNESAAVISREPDDQKSDRNLDLMRAVAFFAPDWPQQCQLWLKHLLNQCLDGADADHWLDSIEDFVFQNPDLIDVQNFVILERFVLKLAISLVSGRFADDAALHNRISELETIFERMPIVYQQFLFIFNAVLIQCNFPASLIQWLAGFLLIRVHD